MNFKIVFTHQCLRRYLTGDLFWFGSGKLVMQHWCKAKMMIFSVDTLPAAILLPTGFESSTEPSKAYVSPDAYRYSISDAPIHPFGLILSVLCSAGVDLTVLSNDLYYCAGMDLGSPALLATWAWRVGWFSDSPYIFFLSFQQSFGSAFIFLRIRIQLFFLMRIQIQLLF